MEDTVMEPSESDQESDFAPKKVINNYRKLLDSDSEEDERIEEAATNITLKSQESDESEKEESGGQSDSGSDVEASLPVVVDRRKNANPKKKILQVKTQRKSASKAMETIKAKMSHKVQEEQKMKNQSEKQRLEREKEIRVPYHKPKQFTLKEFMSRRSVPNPALQLEKIQRGELPMSSVMAIKMRSTGEGLIKFAQQMKEREEEALEFFRSESESDDEDEKANENKENVDKNTEPSVDLPVINEIVSENAIEKTEMATECGETSENDPAHVESSIACEKKPENEKILDTEEAMPVVEEPTEILEEDLPATTSSVPGVPDRDQVLERLREKYKNIPDLKPTIKPMHETSDQSGFSLKTLNEMGSSNSMIDLSSGLIEPRKLTGPEQLFQRFLKTQKKAKPKEVISMNILTVENGILENNKVEVKLEKEIEVDHNRPGFTRGMLQGSLRNIIDKERHDKLMERLKFSERAEFEPEEKPGKCEVDDSNSKDDFEEDIEEEECEETEDEDEEIEETLRREKKVPKGAAGAFLDEEAVDEDASEDESESIGSSSSSEEEDDIEASAPRKGRILKAFVDSEDETDDKPETLVNMETAALESEQMLTDTEADSKADDSKLFNTEEMCSISVKAAEDINEYNTELNEPASDDLFAFTQFTNPQISQDVFSAVPSDFTEPSFSEAGGIEKLCDSAPSQMMDDDWNEICSGRFVTQAAEGTEEPAPEKDNFSDSQFVSQVSERESVTESNLDGADKPLETSAKEVNARKLLDSTDDEAVDVQTEKRKKRKKRRKQPVKKLGFSDDESEAESNHDIDLEAESEEEQEEGEEEVLVDYDSEENEVEVLMKKKDLQKAAGAYFEDEAELSESEWGSADEDEKGLDKFEGELGDEDEFDHEKLQEEVGRIHARKMLDDDIRNVKKIEDLLFEDEENDGVGRERKFRWKNQKEGFSAQDENAQDGDLLEDDNEEEQNEVEWRKMRHDRETVLAEHAAKLAESDTIPDEMTMMDSESQTVTTGSCSSFVKQKFRIIKSSSTMECPAAPEQKSNSMFLIKRTDFKKFGRSSFLSRDDQTLSKIAKLVSTKDDEVTNISHGSNSMSFMTIDKPSESNKRKSAGNVQPDSSKKRKVEPQTKQLLLDRLQ